MNCDDGTIRSYKTLGELSDREIEMKLSPTPIQLGRTPPRVGRNEPCPCGSGNKFKRCHWTGR